MPRLALTLLLVVGFATTAHAQQVDPAKYRAKKLKESVKTFRLELLYNGPEDKPFYRLTLSVPPVAKAEDKPFYRNTQISEEQAKKIIDHLATDGFLGGADDLMRDEYYVLPPPTKPGYTMRVGGLSQDLGWGLPLLKRLDGLRKVLDGQAAKGMDSLLGRLSGLRKQWMKEAIGELVRQLGDDKLAVREAATKKLTDMGEAAHPLLNETLKQADLDMETGSRIKIILGEKANNEEQSVTDPASGVMVAITGDGNELTATKDGKMLWKTRWAGLGAASLRLEGGVVIVSPGNSAYDPATGRLLWKKR